MTDSNSQDNEEEENNEASYQGDHFDDLRLNSQKIE